MGLGYITTNVGAKDYLSSITVLSDGKILGAGVSDGNAILARYSSNGILDKTFGNGGVMITDFGSTEYITDMIVQTDGKIIITGTSNEDIILARYNVNGSLDTTFGGGDGKLLSDFSKDYSEAVTLQADGKILIAGTIGYQLGSVRYNSDGTLDSSYGVGGYVKTVLNNMSVGSDVVVQNDGKIIVGGNTSVTFNLVRYNQDGTLDTSFDGDGKASFSATATSKFVGIQSDGKLLLGGSISADFALLRFNTDGTLDTSFDVDGKVSTGFGSNYYHDYAYDYAIQSDGKIILAGYSEYNGNNDIALVRYNTDGSRDDSFDLDGKVITDLGSSKDFAYDLALQSDGKLIVAGERLNDIVLLRYNTDGSLDTSFGSLSASEHLSTKGISIQQAHDYIVANLSSPSTIYNTCELYHVTNQMIVEIFDNAYSVDIVKGFFSANGLNPATLDLFA